MLNRWTKWVRAAAAAGAVILAATPAMADAAPPRCGLWMAEGAACPLTHTDVDAVIQGFSARVTVTQQYENPTDSFIEAVYTFPLSDRGAVDAMTMKIGDRVIRGVVEEKEKARKLYEAAKNAGQATSLLDQERPNIFTQSVANIPPGETVDITISYVEFLPYKEGAYTFSFPMVVGPRYNPAQVTDAGRISPPVTPENTRAGHDIALHVDLDAGVPVLDLKSELHAVSVDKKGQNRAEIALQQQDSIPNRDFVLTYKVAGDRIRDAVLTSWDDGAGYFALVMQPPAPRPAASTSPRELIFVIDCSGSMRGFPLEKAQRTMDQCLDALRPSDTFNLMSFAGGVGMCFPEPVLANRGSIEKAREYLRDLSGGGGTEMMKAIQAALATPVEADRLRLVCFMTDGFIGNDYEILDAVKKHAGQARVFSFGIGNSVNRFLIEGMAREGRGASEIVTLASDGDEAADRFARRVESPLLRDIEVTFDGVEVEQITPGPKVLPDLFDAQPLVIMGRYTTPGNGTATVTGMTADGPFTKHIDLNLGDDTTAESPLRVLWAREQVAALMHEDWLSLQQGESNETTKCAITELGLEHGLVTPFTSFVAIEERVVNEGRRTKTIRVPVEMPDGVSYEGVFGADSVVAGKPAAVAPATPSLQSNAPRGSSGGGFGLRRSESAAASSAEPMSDRISRGGNESKQHSSASSRIGDDGADEEQAEWDKPLLELSPKVSEGIRAAASASPEGSEFEAVLRLEGLSDARVDALRALGVRVKAVNRGTGEVRVAITKDVLAKVAALDYVLRIDAPGR